MTWCAYRGEILYLRAMMSPLDDRSDGPPAHSASDFLRRVSQKFCHKDTEINVYMAAVCDRGMILVWVQPGSNLLSFEYLVYLSRGASPRCRASPSRSHG